MNDRELRTNGSGYPDPTAYSAIRNICKEKTDEDTERFHKLLSVIYSICELSGFRLEGRITVKDKKTGKVWR